MKERPILFSTPMVQAILNGSKKMTRRLINPQPIVDEDSGYVYYKNYQIDIHRFPLSEDMPNLCKYGKVGDVLWVRESFCLTQPYNPETYYFGYVAGGHSQKPASEKYDYSTPDVVKPSIHMPREACRLLLAITDVRVQRLHDISEEDIIAEGIRIPVNGAGTNRVLLELGGKNKAIDFLPAGCLDSGGPKVTQKELLFAHFAELWCSINGRESCDSNPWVWVISFGRITPATL